MKHLLERIYRLLVLFGINPLQTLHSLKGLPIYFRDFRTLMRQRVFAEKEFPFGFPYPCLEDSTSESGSTKGHYFHQDLLIAQRIYLHNPRIHVDVGSRVDGFVAHLASFRSIEVFDIRPVSKNIRNIRFQKVDLMGKVIGEFADYCDSLSCLHALEHFGLGRYGDTVNYDGYLLGLNNLTTILKRQGKLYLSVPIGPQRIEFNAHRIFSVSYLLKCFSGIYHLDQFSFVDDHGDLHEDISITETDAKKNFGCVYGCGIFEMTKA